MGVLDDIRSRTAQVVERAAWVRIDDARLSALVGDAA